MQLLKIYELVNEEESTEELYSGIEEEMASLVKFSQVGYEKGVEVVKSLFDNKDLDAAADFSFDN